MNKGREMEINHNVQELATHAGECADALEKIEVQLKKQNTHLSLIAESLSVIANQGFRA